jgi:hypothetical protein
MVLFDALPVAGPAAVDPWDDPLPAVALAPPEATAADVTATDVADVPVAEESADVAAAELVDPLEEPHAARLSARATTAAAGLRWDIGTAPSIGSHPRGDEQPTLHPWVEPVS